MFLGEMRPICVNFRDLDLLAAECGHGGDPTCPFANPKDFKKFCDRVQPEWTVVAGPSAGNGTFLWANGRVALFRATKTGPVEIKVKLMDGELLQPPFVTITFPVRELKVGELSFAKHHDVLMDANNGDGMGSSARAPYAAPHWLDKDLDGEATDAGDGKDRRFPLCYTSGSKLALQFVKLADADAPVPEYSAVARAKCLFGDGPSEETLFTFEVESVAQVGNGRFFSAEFPAGSELESDIAFPNSIQRYAPLIVKWEISFADGQFFESGETDNYVYVVRVDPPATPTLESSMLLESVLYLSCGAADRSHSQPQDIKSEVVRKIYSRFEQRNLTCKPYHGSNVADGRGLGYHLMGNSAFTRNELLEATEAPILIDGMLSGTCRAFSELFLSCLGVQGIFGERLVVTPIAPDGSLLIRFVTPIESTSGDQQYPFVFDPLHPDGDDLTFSPIPAQNNDAPPQHFSDHEVSRWAGNVYDPSYGVPIQSSVITWETAGLWGLVKVAETKARYQSVANKDCKFASVQY